MLNKVMLQGRLTKDPETRYTPSGTAVTRFTLAVDRNYVKQGEERKTDFISVTAFAKTAEHIDKYFAKGSGMLLEGSLQTWSKDTPDGKKYGMDVIAINPYFTEKKKSDNVSPATKPKEDIPDESFVPVDDADLPF